MVKKKILVYTIFHISYYVFNFINLNTKYEFFFFEKNMKLIQFETSVHVCFLYFFFFLYIIKRILLKIIKITQQSL
jgi:hypothetical protein